ncbi:MauE/DoxX family redox-associated membrane protein [Rubritalea spongiae]|uniref:MauE/DoxX family redox-associated membrane protein n=1 Tax=Rubritalea spongiae TaxID=430797 RepID=A0ABW5E2G2_9BACT
MVLALLRVLLALVFLIFGGAKLLEIQDFVENVSNFQIAPFDRAPYDMYLAYFLVPLEVMTGVCLLMKWWFRGALVMAVTMTLAFMVAIGAVWARGLNIDCGCAGGSVEFSGYPIHMLLLMVMLGIGVYLVVDLLFPGPEEK